jgi:hypothetical protein
LCDKVSTLIRLSKQPNLLVASADLLHLKFTHIRLYAPFCKACKAFGIKFRKLASEKGDRVNAAREIIRPGTARFGEIEFSSNVKLCKSLGIKKFPSVLIYRGGKDGGEKLTEIECKQKTAIEDIIAEMEQFVFPTGGS